MTEINNKEEIWIISWFLQVRRSAKTKYHKDLTKLEALFFIGPESDHWLCLSLTPSLPPSCLVNLIDMTLACEDAHSKLIEVFTVADVESCWQQFVADLEAEVWS